MVFENGCRLKKQKFILILFIIGFACGFMIANIVSMVECTSKTFNTLISSVRIIKGPDNKKIVSDEDDSFIRCKVPKLDPWDPSIQKFVEHPKSVDCTQTQRFLTFMDADGYLQLNETEVEIMEEQNITFKCFYRTFDRNLGLDDESTLFDEPRILNQTTKLSKDSVEVVCKYDSDGKEFYWNAYAYPVIRDDLTFAKPTEDQLSVLFFIVDSVAHSVLQRNLPKTYNYTKNVMNITFFNAFSKIGTNSFPNQMAMLTGKRFYYEQEDMKAELPEGYDYYKQHFDSWSFIWKYFAAKSYATIFNSDWPSYGMFNYNTIGFSKKLIDYYYHWFYKRIDELKTGDSSDYCFSNEPLPKIVIDLTKHHVIKLQGTANFLFSVLTETTHGGGSDIERSDEYLYKFWKQLYEGNYLNKSFVIFASDHGIRLGKVRPTYTGAMEDRLPYYGLWFPPWFYDRYPHIKRNIENNVDRLTSSFDVYETLKDVVNENYNGAQRSAKSRGQSHFYPVPKNRTCHDAGIADHWCTCNKELHVNPENNTIAMEGAMFMIDHIMDELLGEHSKICQKIVFSKFTFFLEVQFMEDDDKEIKQTVSIPELTKKTNYFLGIETNPNQATFEAYLTLTTTNGTENKWEIRGGLDRTSRYGAFGWCVKDWWLKHFCACY